MQPVILQMAEEYKKNLKEIYGKDMKELILYGSYSRGDYKEESDIDFAIVLRDQFTYPAGEIPKIAAISSRLSLKYGVMISTLPVSFRKKQTSLQGVFQEIRKDGIII
ncbi:MAG: nucleotidyltransferase family protein [Chitinophagaceae bacterium]